MSGEVLAVGMYKVESLLPTNRWQHDRKVDNCPGCKSRFRILVRKHHCRVCGRIYCNDCAPRVGVFSEILVRICQDCQKGKSVTRGGGTNFYLPPVRTKTFHELNIAAAVGFSLVLFFVLSQALRSSLSGTMLGIVLGVAICWLLERSSQKSGESRPATTSRAAPAAPAAPTSPSSPSSQPSPLPAAPTPAPPASSASASTSSSSSSSSSPSAAAPATSSAPAPAPTPTPTPTPAAPAAASSSAATPAE